MLVEHNLSQSIHLEEGAGISRDNRFMARGLAKVLALSRLTPTCSAAMTAARTRPARSRVDGCDQAVAYRLAAILASKMQALLVTEPFSSECLGRACLAFPSAI
jgi:hypothetical protein